MLLCWVKCLVFTFNCSMYPWKGPRTGARVPGGRGNVTVCLYTQWCGVGPCDESEIQSDLAWLPIISSEVSVFKNISVQQG